MTAPVLVDPVATPVAEALLACLESQVEALPDPPAAAMLRPGDRIELLVAQNRDECCEGLAWVRVVSVYPSTDFPAQDETYRKCPAGWAVVVELGVARCAPTPGADEIPDADEWNHVTRTVLADGAAIRRAFLCFTGLDDYRHRQYIPGTWSALTTEGGCVGGSMTVTVHMPYCDTLEDT